MNTVSFNRDLFPLLERRTLLSTCGFKAQLKLTPDRPVSERHRSNSVGARNFWRLLFSNSWLQTTCKDHFCTSTFNSLKFYLSTCPSHGVMHWIYQKHIALCKKYRGKKTLLTTDLHGGCYFWFKMTIEDGEGKVWETRQLFITIF